MMKRAHSVLVLGAGIGGLTAAHELAERGFHVTLVEKAQDVGGKARSRGIPGSGTEGRRDLPAEHGFRFFPGNYRHVFDSMRRTPHRHQRRGVQDNLVRVPYQQQEYPGCPTLLVPTSRPANPTEAAHARRQLGLTHAKTAGFSAEELVLYVEKRWQYLSSCDERRDTEYDAVSWWAFMDAEGRSAAYQDFVGRAPLNFVAARPTRGSMRTLGSMAIQLDRVAAERGNSAAWILNGPTSEAWIDPWMAHLQSLGVERRQGTVAGLVVEHGRIARAIVNVESTPVAMEADYYVSALPVERMAALVDGPVLSADPSMARITELAGHVGWMSGMQYFLDYIPDLPPAHQNYIGSPWAITSIVQTAFWNGARMDEYADGRVRAILSVIVSDWYTPGLLFGKPASDCTPDQIRAEVWHQMRRWADGLRGAFREDGILRFELDAELQGDRATPRYVNQAPLLINSTGSRTLRPEAATAIPNLFLAADYIRTHTDLATMEAANEAGRRAANAVLAAAGSRAGRAGVWAPPEPPFIGLWKAYDRRRFRRGLPWHADAPMWVRWPLVLISAIVRRRFARASVLPGPSAVSPAQEVSGV